jgi:hypothetical protein
MTFNPGVNLAYGTVVDVEISDHAEDESGLEMAADFASDFRIVRQKTETLYSQAAFDGHVYAPAVEVLGSHVDSDEVTLQVGTWQRGFLSFNLSGLPEDLTFIQSAEVTVYQSQHSAGAYGLETGKLMLQSVSYGTLTAGDWGIGAFSFCNGLCAMPFPSQYQLSDSAANGFKSVNVIGAVRQDWHHRDERGERAQFRLKFQAENNGSGPNEWVKIIASEGVLFVPSLQVTYLYP